MPASTKISPVPFSLPGLRVTTYATSANTPFGMSTDRATIFGSSATTGQLVQSVNEGTTWTAIRTFSETVVGCIETDDGEAVVYTIGGSSTPGYAYKSSGWTASKTAATWTKTLTTEGSNGYIRTYWAGGHFCSFGNDKVVAGTSKYGVVSEYGVQSASGDTAGKATRLYFTQDYGTTWTKVLDLFTRYPTVFGLHIHASAYDPYWDRIWVTYGDSQAEPAQSGVVRQALLYSDDHGITWQSVPLPADFAGDYLQSIPIGVFRDHLLLGSDNAPGFMRLDRKGYRLLGDTQEIAVVAASTGAQMLANAIHSNRNQPTAPILATFQGVNTTVYGSIWGSLDGGLTYSQWWYDEANVSGAGPIQIYGPTQNGKIVANAGGGKLMVAEIVQPEGNQYDGRLVATGDGTTTVFSVNHGLPAAPSRYLAWSTLANTAFTTTVTATQIVFTFAAAPANAAKVAIDYRFGS